MEQAQEKVGGGGGIGWRICLFLHFLRLICRLIRRRRWRKQAADQTEAVALQEQGPASQSSYVAQLADIGFAEQVDKKKTRQVISIVEPFFEHGQYLYRVDKCEMSAMSSLLSGKLHLKTFF